MARGFKFFCRLLPWLFFLPLSNSHALDLIVELKGLNPIFEIGAAPLFQSFSAAHPVRLYANTFLFSFEDLPSDLGADETARMLTLIRSFPEVKYVAVDREVEISLPGPNSNNGFVDLVDQSLSLPKPDLKPAPNQKVGRDLWTDKCWSLRYVMAPFAWIKALSTRPVTVAVIDSGLDYNHEDIALSLWRNPMEILGNGVDDDGNGFVDDGIGWDFVDHDGKPFDQTQIAGGLVLNAGHGTHVSGLIGATSNNGLGIRGVAPQAQIMALRFLGKSGSGKVSGALAAIRYAVDNGA